MQRIEGAIAILKTIGLGIVLFATTNVDDVFVLLSLYAGRHFQPRQILVGQYLGFATLVLVSIVASLLSLVFEPEHIGWLGLLPMAIGLKQLLALWRDAGSGAATAPIHSGASNVLAVAGITIANGGDNIGIYVPVFATSSAATIAVPCGTFFVMVAAWLAFARWLVNHPSLGRPIRRYGHVLTPLVLILTGIYILYSAGSIKSFF